MGAKLRPLLAEQDEHELRHHALADALELRRVYLEAQARGAVGWV